MLLLGLVLATFLSANTRAQEPGVTPAERTGFPGADRAGPMQGEPQAAPAFTGERLVGYVLSTAATVGSVGYSGKPLDILMGIDLEARVTGALLRRHNEPILVIGVDDETLKRYVTGFTGIDLRLRPTAVPETGGPGRFPDAIAGATVSSGVICDTILRAGRAVARSRGLLGGAPRRRNSIERASRQRRGKTCLRMGRSSRDGLRWARSRKLTARRCLGTRLVRCRLRRALHRPGDAAAYRAELARQARLRPADFRDRH